MRRTAVRSVVSVGEPGERRWTSTTRATHSPTISASSSGEEALEVLTAPGTAAWASSGSSRSKEMKGSTAPGSSAQQALEGGVAGEGGGGGVHGGGDGVGEVGLGVGRGAGGLEHAGDLELGGRGQQAGPCRRGTGGRSWPGRSRPRSAMSSMLVALQALAGDAAAVAARMRSADLAGAVPVQGSATESSVTRIT